MQDTTLPKHYKRNFWCLASDFAFFGIGMAFISPGTVVPGFLDALNAPSFVIGLVSTLQSASWLLPQLFAARYLADKPLKKPYILLPAAVGRSLILLLSFLIWITGARPAWLAVVMVTLVVIGFWGCDGLASVPWFDLLSKSIPPARRGRLTGVGQVMSGLFGFMAGFLVEWMLSERGPAFPDNYAALYLLGFFMFAGSFIAIAMTVESPGVSARRVPGWHEFLPRLWKVLKSDRTYRHYIIARQIYGLGALAMPFYMTFALDRLGLPAHVAGRYTSIGLVGSILAAMLFGWLNERYGSKLVIAIGVVVSVLPPVCALLTRLPWDPALLAWGYGVVFFFSSVAMSSMMPGWMTFVLEHAPEAERPGYVGLTNTINGVNVLLSAFGGAILEWSNKNYELLFGITALGILLSWPLAFSLPEPRRAG